MGGHPEGRFGHPRLPRQGISSRKSDDLRRGLRGGAPAAYITPMKGTLPSDASDPLANARRAAALEERRCIGQQLHDRFCPNLLGAAFCVKGIVARLPAGSPEREELEEVARLINDSVQQVGGLLHAWQQESPRAEKT
jgi:signal transduction histidine kinase